MKSQEFDRKSVKMTDTDLETVEDRTYWSHLGSIGIQAVHAEVCKSGRTVITPYMYVVKF